MKEITPKESRFPSKWQSIVDTHTVFAGGKEYVALTGVKKLRELALTEILKEKFKRIDDEPVTVLEEFREWIEYTQSMVEMVDRVTEAMEETRERLMEHSLLVYREKMAPVIAEYEKELYGKVEDYPELPPLEMPVINEPGVRFGNSNEVETPD